MDRYFCKSYFIVLLTSNCGLKQVEGNRHHKSFQEQKRIDTRMKCKDIEITRMSFFGHASDLYLCLYNQLFALFHYVFKFLTPEL